MRTRKTKQPFCFEVNEGKVVAFAGIWERWKDPSGQWVKSCSILTATPNAVTAAVHDRMPVILELEGYDLGLDPAMGNVAAACGLLKPYDDRLMRCSADQFRHDTLGTLDTGITPPFAEIGFPLLKEVPKQSSLPQAYMELAPPVHLTGSAGRGVLCRIRCRSRSVCCP